MEPVWIIPIIIGLIVGSVVAYRIVEGLLPTPPPVPKGPRSDFEVLTDAVSDELQRLHSELSTFNAAGDGYRSIVNEIGRLNQKFVDLYDATKPQDQNGG